MIEISLLCAGFIVVFIFLKWRSGVHKAIRDENEEINKLPPGAQIIVEEKKEEKETGKKKEETLLSYFSNDYLPYIIGYVSVLMIVWMLYPDGWRWYWNKQALFWMTQLGIITVIAFDFFRGGWIMWLFRVAIVVLLIIAVRAELRKPKQTDDDTIARQGVAVMKNSDERIIKAPIDEWSERIMKKSGHRFGWNQHPDSSWENVHTLVRIMVNGINDKYHVKDHGYRKDGSTTVAHFDKDGNGRKILADYIQVMTPSEENSFPYPVLMRIRFIKKKS